MSFFRLVVCWTLSWIISHTGRTFISSVQHKLSLTPRCSSWTPSLSNICHLYGKCIQGKALKPTSEFSGGSWMPGGCLEAGALRSFVAWISLNLCQKVKSWSFRTIDASFNRLTAKVNTKQMSKIAIKAVRKSVSWNVNCEYIYLHEWPEDHLEVLENWCRAPLL